MRELLVVSELRTNWQMRFTEQGFRCAYYNRY
jgi:hypothetical protein